MPSSTTFGVNTNKEHRLSDSLVMKSCAHTDQFSNTMFVATLHIKLVFIISTLIIGRMALTRHLLNNNYTCIKCLDFGIDVIHLFFYVYVLKLPNMFLFTRTSSINNSAISLIFIYLRYYADQFHNTVLVELLHVYYF